jgi:Domain of unknown function (DUF4350)
MTETRTGVPPAAPAAPPATGDGRFPRLRRNRALLVVVGLVVAGLALLLLVGPDEPTPTDPLEPGNPNPDGARAVARVLADQGVEVTVARGQAELSTAEIDAATTVFVTSTEALSAHTSSRLRALGADAGTLVLAGASTTTVRVMGLGVDAGGVWPQEVVEADCADPLLQGLELEVQPTTAHARRAGAGAGETCFPVDVEGRAAGLVTRIDGRPTTYLVGGTELFSNGRITEADAAAVALRLLGGHDRLVWYVADAADVPPGDAGSLRSLLPPGLGLATVLVGLALLAVMVWRGRRLGPLVAEPLPVVVKAVESTAGRGRLYSRARDRDHAAALLRDATTSRVTDHLKLPAGTPLPHLVEVVAEQVRRDPRDVRRILEHGPVPDDRSLTLLAQELAELEREVRQP